MNSPVRKTSAAPRSSAEFAANSTDVQGGLSSVQQRRSKNRSGFAISQDGTPIFYEVSGRHRPALTLLLCDGIGCDGYVWKYLQRVLGDDYRIIHLQYRGHGKTPAPHNLARITIPDLADDVEAVLD